MIFLKEKNENTEEKTKIKKSPNKNSPQGLSQKEIDLFEIQKKKKKKYYKEIGFLIMASIVDMISNLLYLVSYASINEKKDNNTSSNNSTSNIIDEIIMSYVLSNNSTDNSTDINNTIDNENKNDNDNIINIIPFRIFIRISIFFLLSLLFFYYDRPHRHQLLSV